MIANIPDEACGIELRRRLQQKMDNFITQSRDASMSKVKDFELSLPKLMASIKAQEEIDKKTPKRPNVISLITDESKSSLHNSSKASLHMRLKPLHSVPNVSVL